MSELREEQWGHIGRDRFAESTGLVSDVKVSRVSSFSFDDYE